ncbi:hypothetical protein [uncultured Gammaproteobacteria bacterium]|nr:hypothetical protein [uncultured Gammaproteobacteria bacterium]CAC9572375.1 hypothetical protein [uncultured Gammaproteobacteria bacterium]CAC9573603.1 hypothetical protein [uncultured Gammaproteobacteria bacterium]
MPLQYTAMKISVLLLLISLLSGCLTISKQSEQAVYSNSIPNVWTIIGRISATNKGETETANFQLNQQNGYNQLTLTGALGFGQTTVKQTTQGLLVNNELTYQTLKEWMTLELGWYFPVNALANIVFKHNNNNIEDWQISTNKRRVFNGVAYPKIIRLNHSNKHLKIKLLLQEVNRLK